MAGVANASKQVINPYAPLVWVPTDIAGKLSSELYAEVGALAVLIWDIILHIPEDYEILRRSRITTMTIVYFFARLSTLTHLIGLVIATTAPIGNCNIIRYMDFIYPFTLPFSILHFVFRASAIYNNNKYVLAFFTLSWFAVLGTSIMWPFGVQGQQLGPTNYCVEIKSNHPAMVAALCLFVHDTLVFLATSLAFISQSCMDNDIKLGTMFLGRNLPKFTRTVLRDGQAYFLTSLVVHSLFFSQYFARSQFAFPCSIGIPSFVLINTMSAYVYRNIRLGLYRDYTMTNSMHLEQCTTSSHSQRDMSVAFNQKTGTGLSREVQRILEL